MPENEVPTEQTRAEPVAAPAGETKAQKLEREQLSRRAALRKLGYTSVLSVFALFSVDDLARMVGKAMEQKARDSEVAEVVARELQQDGVTSAATTATFPYGVCNTFQNTGVGCNACNNERYNYCIAHCIPAECSTPFTNGTNICTTNQGYAALTTEWDKTPIGCLASRKITPPSPISS